MHRLLTLLIAPFIVVAAASAWAQSVGDTATVATERLNLRSGPGTEHNVVQEMPEGTILRVAAIQDGWAQVTVLNGGATGWTSARFLAIETASPANTGVFSELIAEHGEPYAQGYLPSLDIYYAVYCRNGPGLTLVRGSDDVRWEMEAWCGRGLSAIDVDGDGTDELAFFSSGGGTGTYAVKETHLTWPPNAAEPTLGFEYTTLQADTWGTPFDVVLQTETVREMQYGQDCRVENYCPSWPPEAECRAATMCEITQIRTIKLSGGDTSQLAGNPEWEAWFVERFTGDGWTIVGEEVSLTLTNALLADLATLDSGETPEVTPEREAMLVEWLQ